MIHLLPTIIILISTVYFKLILPYTSYMEIHTHKSNNKLKENLKKSPYSPNFLYTFSIIQAILHAFLPLKKIYFKREQYKLKNGGIIGIDHAVFPFNQNRKKESKERILVLLHGLINGTNSCQIRDLIYYFAYEDKVFNQIISIQNRGINDIPFTCPNLYTAYSHNDIKESLDHIISQNSVCELYLIGNSLGSVILTNLLFEYKKIKQIKAFISISNPYTFKNSSLKIKNHMIYSKIFTESLKTASMNHPILFSSTCKTQFNSISNIIEFEETMIIKENKEIFNSLHHYYELTACSDKIKFLNTPSLYINSIDDPISPLEGVKKEDFYENENITLLITRFGFHVCFFEGLFSPKRWYLKVCSDYFRSFFSE